MSNINIIRPRFWNVLLLKNKAFGYKWISHSIGICIKHLIMWRALELVHQNWITVSFSLTHSVQIIFSGIVAVNHRAFIKTQRKKNNKITEQRANRILSWVNSDTQRPELELHVIVLNNYWVMSWRIKLRLKLRMSDWIITSVYDNIEKYFHTL